MLVILILLAQVDWNPSIKIIYILDAIWHNNIFRSIIENVLSASLAWPVFIKPLISFILILIYCVWYYVPLHTSHELCGNIFCIVMEIQEKCNDMPCILIQYLILLVNLVNLLRKICRMKVFLFFLMSRI